jgi:hypothetical protein
MFQKFTNHLAEHPELGILGLIKIFTIETIINYSESVSALANLMADIGKIAGGVLAVLTLMAWIAKRVVMLCKEIKK